MQNTSEQLSQAREKVLESWDIFSVSGEINDAREMMNDIAEYDRLLSTQNDMEIEQE